MLSKIEDNYVAMELAGRSEEQSDTFGDMKRAFCFGGNLCNSSIYIQSFLLPVCIIAVIPFILIGVILGHWITGFDITILSLVAMLGLGGIVVND